MAGTKGSPRCFPPPVAQVPWGPRAPSPIYIYKYNPRNKPETTRDQRCVLPGGTGQSSKDPRSRRAAPLPSHGASSRASPLPAQSSFPSVHPSSVRPSLLPAWSLGAPLQCGTSQGQGIMSLCLAAGGRCFPGEPVPTCADKEHTWAWHQWVGWERGHGQQLPLECGAARDPLRGSHLPPDGGGDGTPQDRAVMYLMPLRAKEHSGMWLFPAPPSLCTEPGTGWRVPSRAEQCGGAGGCICLIPVLIPVLQASCPPQCPFWWQRGEDPTSVPHPATPAAPRSITSHPPGQGQWVPGSSQNLGPNLAQALRQGGGIRGSWGTPRWSPSLLGVRWC